MWVFGWLLAALMGWTAIGVLGTLLAFFTGDRRRAARSAGWIVGVWVLYLAVLLGVSAIQKQRVVARGQEECFGTMCFMVTGVQSSGEFREEGDGQLVQLDVRVRNTGTERAWVEDLRAYLVGGDGRQWGQTRGVGGVALTVRLPAGAATVSEPMFRVSGEVKDLSLMLTRGHSGWGWLVIGSTDALGHRRTVLRLE